MSATQTTNLGLNKPDRSDYVSVVNDLNDNMDIIDGAYGNLATGKVPSTRKVNGHALSSDVTVTKGDVGLGNVDNTSDANKPISNAQALVNTNTANQIIDLKSALNGYYDDIVNKAYAGFKGYGRVVVDKLFGKYSTNTAYVVTGVTVGETTLSQIQTLEASGYYAAKIPVRGVKRLAYPTFKSSTSRGCFIFDNNDVVLWMHSETSYDTGYMKVVDVPSNAEYMLLSLNATLASESWAIRMIMSDSFAETSTETDDINNGYKVLYLDYHIGDESSYNASFTPAASRKGYAKITNIGNSSAYITLTLYKDGSATTVTTGSQLVASGASLVLNLPVLDTASSYYIAVNNSSNKTNNRLIISANMLEYIEDNIDRIEDKLNTGTELIALQTHNVASSETTKSIVLDLTRDGRSKSVVIKNKSASAGYVYFKAYDENNNVLYDLTNSQMINANDSFTLWFNDLAWYRIDITNPNSKNLELSINCYNTVGRPKLYVGPNRDITKFYDGLVQAVRQGNTDLYVDSGEYDIIDEMTLAEVVRVSEAGLYGPRIGHNVRIYFASEAKIICHYEGDNTSVLTMFSPFNSIESDVKGASDFEVHGGFIDCSRIRYCVHDEGNGRGQGTHVFDNVNMYLDNTDNERWTSKSCIGGGIGQYTTVLVDGGIYESEGAAVDSGVIYYHNTVNANQDTAYARIAIRNVYFKNGHCQVNPGGTGTKKSEFVVTNCSMESEPSIAGGSGNFVMYAWNNEIRPRN